MNKTDLVAAMAVESGLSKTDTKKVLESFLRVVSRELNLGRKLTIAGHGTYKVIEKTERKGVHPRTLVPIQIAPRKSVKFKPAKELLVS